MLPLAEYRAISVQDEDLPLTRAATRINQAIYSSVVLEKGTGKIKSLQITYLPESDAEVNNTREKGKREAKNGADSTDRQLAIRYIAAIMQSFSPHALGTAKPGESHTAIEPWKKPRLLQSTGWFLTLCGSR
ncbi:Protein of uncharacterised function (DUF1454) [Edwardsiella tarda]|nr:Protein of uncharacterised function (DUF1454) [Edwardsiella tarda]